VPRGKNKSAKWPGDREKRRIGLPPPPSPVLKTQKRDLFRVRNFFASGPFSRCPSVKRAPPQCPLSGRKAEKRDELAPPHSITSSALASNDCGTMRFSALAVVRLITSWYLVGCWTGNSATFAPFRIRSAYDAAPL